mmetsp:Transcript_8245/g.24772  ORF Transcript_8245/g.24772 Transcript_8245/m.24772 type:complete len:185 (-) Transcript_8245:1915-2469(-)
MFSDVRAAKGTMIDEAPDCYDGGSFDVDSESEDVDDGGGAVLPAAAAAASTYRGESGCEETLILRGRRRYGRKRKDGGNRRGGARPAGGNSTLRMRRKSGRRRAPIAEGRRGYERAEGEHAKKAPPPPRPARRPSVLVKGERDRFRTTLLPTLVASVGSLVRTGRYEVDVHLVPGYRLDLSLRA